MPAVDQGGSPTGGSTRQFVHNLGGAVEYIGGGFALVGLGESLGSPFRILGLVVLGTTIVLSVMPFISVRGLIQRIAEACLFGGLALSIWRGGMG